MRGAFLTVTGVVLVLVTLRDAWHTVFHPNASGQLERVVARELWGAARRCGARHHVLALAGPAALTTVIVLWILGLGLGWALVWAPYVPAQLHFEGIVADPRRAPWDALYLSFRTLRTLGGGDVAPASEWTRLVELLESFIGFGIVTAAITWLLSTFPILARRRTLARDVHALLDAIELHREGGLRGVRSSTLDRLSERIAQVTNDLGQSPVLYYFHDANERSALDAVLPALALLARAATARRPLSLAALQLQQALAGLAGVLREDVGLEGADTDAILDAYARDHRRSPRYVPELTALWRRAASERPLRPPVRDTTFRSGGVERRD